MFKYTWVHIRCYYLVLLYILKLNVVVVVVVRSCNTHGSLVDFKHPFCGAFHMFIPFNYFKWTKSTQRETASADFSF